MSVEHEYTAHETTDAGQDELRDHLVEVHGAQPSNITRLRETRAHPEHPSHLELMHRMIHRVPPQADEETA